MNPEQSKPIYKKPLIIGILCLVFLALLAFFMVKTNTTNKQTFTLVDGSIIDRNAEKIRKVSDDIFEVTEHLIKTDTYNYDVWMNDPKYEGIMKFLAYTINTLQLNGCCNTWNIKCDNYLNNKLSGHQNTKLTKDICKLNNGKIIINQNTMTYFFNSKDSTWYGCPYIGLFSSYSVDDMIFYSIKSRYSVKPLLSNKLFIIDRRLTF